MSREPNWTTPLIIADGDVTGLVSMAMAAEERISAGGQFRPVVWIPPLGDPTSAPRLACARVQAELYDAIIADDPAAHVAPAPAPVEGFSVSELLLRGCFVAAEHHCSRVIWPAHAGADEPDESALDRLSRAADRALLVSRLASVDAAEAHLNEISIQTPLLDLCDWRVAELALDLRVPVSSCWWWGGRAGGRGERGGRVDHPGAEQERERWLAALARAGWHGAPPGADDPAAIVPEPSGRVPRPA